MMLCRDIDGFVTSWVHLIVQVFVEYLQAWDLAKPIQLCPVEEDRFVWGGPPLPFIYSMASTYRVFFHGHIWGQEFFG